MRGGSDRARLFWYYGLPMNRFLAQTQPPRGVQAGGRGIAGVTAGAMALVLAAGAAQAQQPAGGAKAAPKGNTVQAAAPAQAPGGGQATLLASFGDWGAYAAQRDKSKLCYAMTQPKNREPKNLNRDPAYLFVSSQPADGVRNEVSLVMGFPAKDGVDATAAVGQANFALVTKVANAWVKNPAEEGRVIDALKKGDKLVVRSESKRGSKLTDEYSLKGFNEALARVQRECP
jgi:invasion protein IalB